MSFFAKKYPCFVFWALKNAPNRVNIEKRLYFGTQGEGVITRRD